MKLEAVNGNLMSMTVKNVAADLLPEEQEKTHEHQIQQLQQESQAESQIAAANTEMVDMSVAAMAGDEVEELQSSEDKDGGAGGGKKKGTRKKRSLNWEEAERGLLLEVIKPKVEFVENRSVDAKNIKAKRLAWLHVTKQFNALNFRHRSLEQIQVQWRSMKNTGKREFQQKNPKIPTIEGMALVEFMEELQKDPVSQRSQTRGGGGHGAGHKKNTLPSTAAATTTTELDDEDMPLAALPTSSDDNTLQTSTTALPSPPPSGDSQNGIEQITPTRNKKKKQQQMAQAAEVKVELKDEQNIESLTPAQPIQAPAVATVTTTTAPPPPPSTANNAQKQATTQKNVKRKRQRSQNSQINLDNVAITSPTTAVPTVNATVAYADVSPPTLPAAAAAAAVPTTTTLNTPSPVAVAGSGNIGSGSSSTTTTIMACTHAVDEKSKKQLFDLLKRARLNEIDYALREFELKQRYYEMEMELKLRQMKKEHELRMHHWQLEHEARMRAYAASMSELSANVTTTEPSSACVASKTTGKIKITAVEKMK